MQLCLWLHNHVTSQSLPIVSHERAETHSWSSLFRRIVLGKVTLRWSKCDTVDTAFRSHKVTSCLSPIHRVEGARISHVCHKKWSFHSTSYFTFPFHEYSVDPYSSISSLSDPRRWYPMSEMGFPRQGGGSGVLDKCHHRGENFPRGGVMRTGRGGLSVPVTKMAILGWPPRCGDLIEFRMNWGRRESGGSDKSHGEGIRG